MHQPIKERSNFWEFIINFSLFYSFIVGIIFVSYSIYRNLFNTYYYVIALIIYLIYVIFWIKDKIGIINEDRTES